jgi:hypothetical protein
LLIRVKYTKKMSSSNDNFKISPKEQKQKRAAILFLHKLNDIALENTNMSSDDIKNVQNDFVDSLIQILRKHNDIDLENTNMSSDDIKNMQNDFLDVTKMNELASEKIFDNIQ